MPKRRQGTFSAALLERRRRVDHALFAVLMEAYPHGVCTRTVDDLVEALGADSGILKSEVARICSGLDEEVAQFRNRDPATLDYPYVLLDATYCKARVNHRMVSRAVLHTVFAQPDSEHISKEIEHCTDMVGVFPNPAALLRLAGSVRFGPDRS